MSATKPKLPPWRVAPSDQDEAARYRTERRLLEMAEHQAMRKAEAQQERIEKELKENYSPYEVAISAIFDDENSEPQVKRFVLISAPEDLRKLSATAPYLITGLMWRALDHEVRREFLERRGRSLEMVGEDDIFDVLSEADREFLSSWQSCVNDGSAWNNAPVIFDQAKDLIHNGFLLQSHTPTDGLVFRSRSRTEVLPGTPGSAPFVGAMMGPAYLAWIEAIP